MKTATLILLSFIVFNSYSQKTDPQVFWARISKSGKPFLTKEAIKLLKEFDTVRNINSGITSYTHKGIKTGNPTTTTTYNPFLHLSLQSTTPSSIHLIIYRLPDGTFTLSMSTYYVFSSNATTRIEQVASYDFKWESNSYTMLNKKGGYLAFQKYLDDTDYAMFIELAKSKKDAEVTMNGTNSLQKQIDISKHDKQKMLETLELFQALTQ